MLDVSTEYQAQAQRVSHFRFIEETLVPYQHTCQSSLPLFPRVGNLLSAFEPAAGNTSHGKREQDSSPTARDMVDNASASGAVLMCTRLIGDNGARYTDNGWQSLDERQKAVFCHTRKSIVSICFVM